MLWKRTFQSIAMPLLALILWQAAFSQTKNITGKVVDSKDGKPVPGATVLVKGTKIGTSTDAEGNFTLSVNEDAKALIVTGVGFDRQELTIGLVNRFAVSLKPANNSLNEVVVVAYGTRKKSDLTGAVTSISEKDFQKGNINSPEQLLQGKVAGLQITTGGGAAGGGSKIRIRSGASLNANNDPLIVIDGVPTDGGGVAGSANILNTINPNDIESINVLKDASATALYGSRASNGVLIITTKKGTRGKPQFNFNTLFSVGVVPKTVDVLTGDQMRTLLQKNGTPAYQALLGTSNTDWQNEIYQAAPATDNNLSVRGSVGKIPYRLSVGYLNQAGVLKTNKFDRFSSSLNLNPKFFDDHLSVSVAAKASSTTNRFADEGAIGSAVSFDPTQPVRSANKYGGYFEWLQADGKPIDLATRNPVALLDLRHNTSNVFRFIGNVQLDYKLHFLPDLHVLFNLGVDYQQGSGHDNIDSTSATNYKTLGRYAYYNQYKRNQLTDISLFYNMELPSIKSKFDILVGHSYQDFLLHTDNYPAYGATGTVIPGTTPNFAFDEPRYRLESYLARVNYTLANKYLLTASVRRDASSKFAPDNRVGYFPSVALAWRMKEEFFKNNQTVNDLKLRLGWGVTGQQDIGDYYGYLPRYTLSTSTAQYQFGNTFYSFLRPSGYDPNIKWETTTTQNIGVDFALLDNRITGSVDFYNKKTRDLLSTVPVAPGSNFVNQLLTNVGNIENRGVEIVINTIPIRKNDFQWDFGFNVTYQTSKITNLLKQQDPKFTGIDVSGIAGGTGNTIQKHAVGYRPYTFFVYKQVYDKSGKPIEGLYEDLNRDGKIDDADRYFYKQGSPDFLLGFNTTFTYKKYSLGLAAHGMIGNYLYNNVNSDRAAFRNVQNPINFVQNAPVSYFNTGFFNNQYLSDYYVENASFFRLDNINLGYNVGKVFGNKASMRLAASVQNVFVITKYSGLDPELANEGIDNAIYPRPRIFSLGLNLDF